MFSSKRKIVRLFGIGGNLKTSLISSELFNNYIKVPEFNRELNRLMEPYGEGVSTPMNMNAKYILLKTLLQTDCKRIVMDRSLIDYAIMNYIIINYLDDYFGASHEALTIEAAMKLEHELFDNQNTINILLITSDLNFIKNMIDNSWDERAKFFDDHKTYIKSQEFYKDVIINNFPDTHIIDLGDMSDIHKTIETVKSKIIKYL